MKKKVTFDDVVSQRNMVVMDCRRLLHFKNDSYADAEE